MIATNPNPHPDSKKANCADCGSAFIAQYETVCDSCSAVTPTPQPTATPGWEVSIGKTDGDTGAPGANAVTIKCTDKLTALLATAPLVNLLTRFASNDAWHEVDGDDEGLTCCLEWPTSWNGDDPTSTPWGDAQQALADARMLNALSLSIWRFIWDNTWQPISEAPRDGSAVLVGWLNDYWDKAFWDDKSQQWTPVNALNMYGKQPTVFRKLTNIESLPPSVRDIAGRGAK